MCEIISTPSYIRTQHRHDLAGSKWECVLDWYDSTWYSTDGNSCKHCSNLDGDIYRVAQGGCWGNGDGDVNSYLRATYRIRASLTSCLGFRCAKDLL